MNSKKQNLAILTLSLLLSSVAIEAMNDYWNKHWKKIAAVGVAAIGIGVIFKLSQKTVVNDSSSLNEHGSSSLNEENDVVIELPNQTTRINSCRKIVVTAAALNNVLEIDGRVEGDVTINADKCKINVLRNGSFGSSNVSNIEQGNVNIVVSGGGSVTINGKKYTGTSRQLTVNGKDFELSSSNNKPLDIDVSVNAANAVFYPPINGSVEIAKEGVYSRFINAIRGTAHVKGNNCTIDGGVDLSATIEGNECTINGGVGGTARVTGDDCTIRGRIAFSTTIKGNRFKTIIGGIGGTATVTGHNCTIDGPVANSATIEGNECTINGGVGGTARVTGHNCTIGGPVANSATIEGNECTVNGGVGGTARVTGHNCTIRGDIANSATVRRDTVMGRVGGTKRFL